MHTQGNRLSRNGINSGYNTSGASYLDYDPFSSSYNPFQGTVTTFNNVPTFRPF